LVVKAQVPLVLRISSGKSFHAWLPNPELAFLALNLVRNLRPPLGDVVNEIRVKKWLGITTQVEFARADVDLRPHRPGLSQFDLSSVEFHIAHGEPRASIHQYSD
jgi:hypothetical protein